MHNPACRSYNPIFLANQGDYTTQLWEDHNKHYNKPLPGFLSKVFFVSRITVFEEKTLVILRHWIAMASAPRLAMTKYWLKLVKFLLPKRVFPSTHMYLFRVSFWPSVSICPVRTCGSHWWCIVARCATPHVSRPALEPFFTHSALKVGGAVPLWSEWPMARRLSQPCT